MIQRNLVMALAAIGILSCSGVRSDAAEMTATEKKECRAKLGIEAMGDQPEHTLAGTCSFKNKNGFPMPDPACTPGAINPSLTLEVLKDPTFKTECVRDAATTEAAKVKKIYAEYGMTEPADNKDSNQTCELDHFISLELGGADTFDNVWPQCGPGNVELKQRFFKQKDIVEDFLAREVREGRVSLADAQRQIVENWTQFLDEAGRACANDQCRKTE